MLIMQSCARVQYGVPLFKVTPQNRYSTLKEVVSLFMKSTHHLRRNSKPLKMSDSVFVKSVRIATVVTLYW